MRRSPFLLTFAMLVFVLPLAACGGKATKDGDKTVSAELPKQEPVENLYNAAAARMDAGEFLEAAKAFEDVDREYPYSPWAKRAQLMAGFAYYKQLKYDEALLALDRFIELHPGDEQAAYAYYLRGLCYYEQISDVRRDQQMTALALENLQQVIERFPGTTYARDASLKIDLTQDHLAGKEMEIGRYYLERKQFQAAINRFLNVVNEHQTTTHVPEALLRLTEAYVSLGLDDEARRTASVLGHNYPDSSWYKDAYRVVSGKADTTAQPKKSLYERTLGKVF